MHIAQIGTGRVGRPTAYAIMCLGIADKFTLCDVKPGLAAAFAEELNHVTASNGLDVEIVSCENDKDVAGADMILISAGEPRTPGVKMTRRDLAIQNAKIIKQVSEAVNSKIVTPGSVIYTGGNAATPQILLKQLVNDKSIKDVELISISTDNLYVKGKSYKNPEESEKFEIPVFRAAAGRINSEKKNKE